MGRKFIRIFIYLTLGVLGLCLLCGVGSFVINSLDLLPESAPTLIPTNTSETRVLEAPTEPPASATPLRATPTDAPTVAPTDTPEPAIPLPASAEAVCVPKNTTRELGIVTRVVDGDTIEAVINGQTFKVRYIGMDAQESTSETETLGEEATAKNKELVENQTIVLVKDESETDQYDRLLRYVFAGDLFVNYELVKQGFATALTYPPDVACSDTFSAAERVARDAGIGLWALAAISPPKATTIVLPTETLPPAPPTPTATKPSGGGGKCDKSYPDVCIPPRSQVGDLDCKDISFRRFRVLPPDPHNFDGDHDGIGCES